jgi:hypothetical protein
MKTAKERREALIIEAGRIKARLDAIAAQLNGDPAAWIHIAERMPDVGEVYLDKVLAEARQQAATLTSIVRALDGTLSAQPAPAPENVDPTSELEQRRLAKLAKAAGSQL